MSLFLIISHFGLFSYGKLNEKKNEQNENKFANSNFQKTDKMRNQKDSKKQRIHHTYQAARPDTENKSEETGAK